MAETPGTTTASHVGQKLAAARALKPLILRHRERRMQIASCHTPFSKRWPTSVSSAHWCPSAPGAKNESGQPGLQVVEELSTVDGAVGWNAGMGSAANAIVSGWVAADVGRTVFGQDPIGLVAGAGAPMGTARPVAGGYCHRPVAVRQQESPCLLVPRGLCG
jgi:hypothetical protein